jgi:hypothetical protein
MLELYFVFYRIPRMMTRLARARKRSAWRWSLIGIGAWIGGELVAGFAAGLIHGIGIMLWGWPVRSPGFSALTYILALAGALISVTIVSRILAGKSTEESFPSPPPPPEFHQTSEPLHVD